MRRLPFGRALSRHFGFKPRDLVLEQINPLGELADRKQRQILPDLVGDLFLRQSSGSIAGILPSFNLNVIGSGRGCHISVASSKTAANSVRNA